MSRSSWLKVKDEKGSRHNCDEGSAARTRPFSFEEIMLRRENKKLSENVKEVAAEVGNISREEIIKDVSDCFESERGYKENKDAFPIVEKYVSEKSVKVSSRKKEENSSMKKDAVVKGKDTESYESDTKLKDKKNKDLSYEAKLGKNDRKIHGRRKDSERLTDDSANEAEKKHSRDLASKDRHADRSRGKPERESKRKYRNGDDEKNRDWNTVKKRDQGKQRDLDVSERKERKELSKSRFEESRLKRRRSRSQERGAKSRRSISISPRAHKPKSHHGGEHREFSSHSLKDRSGRQHSDIDRNRVSSNGMSSHYQRHGGYTGRLGGYSPRKRRIESAVKTSSPSSRSPEKKSAGWDLQPVGTATVFSGPVTSNFQSSSQDVVSTVNEIASAVSVSVSSTAMMSLSGVSTALPTKTNASIDSVQLTQATRPMRRLYVDNIPSSASEKAVMECFNNFLLSYGANRVQGTLPCFNCVVSVTIYLFIFLDITFHAGFYDKELLPYHI